MPLRTVTLCRHVPKIRRGHGGGRTALWAFSAEDIAQLLGLPGWKVRRMVASGQLDPTDLESLARAWAERARASVAKP